MERHEVTPMTKPLPLERNEMQFGKLYTEKEIIELVTKATQRVGEDMDEPKVAMATALVGVRITQELDEMFEEMKEGAKKDAK